MRVKGTLLLNYVKVIRANPNRDYSKLLTPEDWEIINGKVLASLWYPYDNFRRISFATFQVVGEGKLEMARFFGRFVVQDLLDVYQNFLSHGDPAGTIGKLVSLQSTFFDGKVKLEVLEKETDRMSLTMDIQKVENDEIQRRAFYEAFAGNLEALIEVSGAKLNKVVYQEKDGDCKFLVLWETKPAANA